MSSSRTQKQLLLAGLLSILISSPALAVPKWSCGAWKKDPAGKCEEIRTCTRTVCDTPGKIDSCRNETKTECANPIPPKAGSPHALPWPIGSVNTMDDKGATSGRFEGLPVQKNTTGILEQPAAGSAPTPPARTPAAVRSPKPAAARD